MDVRHIALLAKLSLTKNQEKKFSSQFADTLDTINVINRLDTSGVESTFQVSGLKNVTREDTVDDTRVLSQTQVTSRAGRTYQGFIVVPPVFND